MLAVCAFHLRGAKTLIEAIPWGTVASKIGRAFPIAIIGLFATGANMTSDVWTWGYELDLRVDRRLVVVAVQGPLVAERAGHRLGAALQENGPGPLGEHARRMRRQPTLWIPEYTNLALVLGIVWNMTEKPGTASAVATLVIAYAVGVALALWLSRAPADAPVASTEPAG